MQFIVLGITLLILIVNVLVGIKRGFGRGLLRLITLVLAAVLAFVLAKALAGTVSDTVQPYVEQMLASNPNAASFMQENPAIGNSVGALTRMLVAPFLFLVCYVVLKIVTWVVYLLLRVILRVKKSHNPLFRLAGGAAMGFLAGIIGVLVFVTPVLGYTTLLGRTVDEAENLTAKVAALPLEEYNEQYVKPASEAPVAAQVYSTVGSKLFNGLTTTEWDGQDVRLEDEWFAVVGVVDHAVSLGNRPVAEYGEAESVAVHAMAAGVGESHLLSGIGGGAVNGVANAWLSGNTFMGVAKPATGDESVDVIFNGLLRVLATTDPELFGEDMEMFADLFDLFIKHEMFSQINGEGTDQLITHLVTSGFLDEARALLKANPRLEPITDSISDVGMRMLVRELGDPAKYLEQHGALMNSMSGVLKGAVNEDGSMNMPALTTNLNTVFAENNVTVPASATDIIAEGLADEFTAEELSTLSVDEITDRMVQRFGNVDQISQFVDGGAQEAA